jgi:hypothetical protein
VLRVHYCPPIVDACAAVLKGDTQNKRSVDDKLTPKTRW